MKRPQLASSLKKNVPATVRGPKGAGIGKVTTAQYQAKYGTKLKSGLVAYKGINHRHWARKCYDSRWRCWVWFCPSACGWYYWCGDRGLYLPVRYITVVAPTQTERVVEEGGEEEGALPPDRGEVEEATEEEIPDLPEPE